MRVYKVTANGWPGLEGNVYVSATDAAMHGTIPVILGQIPSFTVIGMEVSRDDIVIQEDGTVGFLRDPGHYYD